MNTLQHRVCAFTYQYLALKVLFRFQFVDSDEAKRAACKFLEVKGKEGCEIQYRTEESKLIF